MSSKNCERIGEMLAEYADGELCREDSQDVTAHLAQCDACRQQLRLLQRSIELAQAVWQESAVGVFKPRGFRTRPTRRISPPVRVAASVAVLIVTARLLMAGGIGHVPPEPYDTLRVSGRVTYEDGTPMPVGRMTVVFTPHAAAVEKSIVPRPAQAEVHVEDGTFSEVTTHRAGDGLILGHHSVEAFSYDGEHHRVPLAIYPTEIEVSRHSIVFGFKVRR